MLGESCRHGDDINGRSTAAIALNVRLDDGAVVDEMIRFAKSSRYEGAIRLTGEPNKPSGRQRLWRRGSVLSAFSRAEQLHIITTWRQ